MTVEELIKELKKFDKNEEVCLLDHRCLEAFPTAICEVRKARVEEAEQAFFGESPVIID